MNRQRIFLFIMGVGVFWGRPQEVLAQHKGISFQAVIKKSDGSVPNVTGISVIAQILDPIQNCVLREELHSGKNISNGYLNLVLGDSSASTPVGYNPSPVLSLSEVMDNKTTRTGLKCVDQANNIVGTGQSYIPSNLDRRVLRVRLNLQGQDIAADFNMRAVGFAVNSEMLNSKTDEDFLNINNLKGVTKANVESIFDRFAKLDSIINSFNNAGTSAGINISGNAATSTSATNVSGTVAIANGGTGATTAGGARTNLGLGSLATMSPTGTADSTTYLRGDGTWQAVSGGGAVSSVAGRTGAVTLSSGDVSGLGVLATKSTSGTADNTTYLRGDGAWTSLGGAALLSVGTGAGTVAAGNDSRITGAIQNSGTDNASNVVSISAGLDSARPASPVAGQMFVATDSQKIYRHNGTVWITVAEVGASGFSGSLTGDVSGTQSATSVDKIKGMPVSNAAVANGKYLKYDSGTWVASIIGIGDLVSTVTGVTQFTTASCSQSQTLTWTSLTDSFVCQNISLPSGQVTGLGALAAKASVDLGTSEATGTLAAGRMPALTGDVTLSLGTTVTSISNNAITTAKINDLAVTDAKINDVAFSKVSGRPTTLAGYGITDALPNTGSTNITTLGTVTTGTWNGSIIPVVYGGTGSATGSISGTTSLTFTAGGSNTNVNLVPQGTGTVDVSNKKITSLATPTASTDAATKAYVDAAGGSGNGVPTMISPETGSTSTVLNSLTYCRALVAPCARTSEDVACDATNYSDWRLPTADELGVFYGITGATTNYLWTRSVHHGNSSNYVSLRLDTTGWVISGNTIGYYVRCVR